MLGLFKTDTELWCQRSPSSGLDSECDVAVVSMICAKVLQAQIQALCKCVKNKFTKRIRSENSKIANGMHAAVHVTASHSDSHLPKLQILEVSGAECRLSIELQG